MKNLTKPRISVLLGLLSVPSVTFAANRTLSDLVSLLAAYMQQAIYLIMALAVLTFIWGIYNYYFKQDADRGEGVNYVLYGTVGFFIMLSFWGLVNIIRNTLDLDNTAPNIPVVQSLQFNTSRPVSTPVGGGGGYVAPVTGGGGINPVTGQPVPGTGGAGGVGGTGGAGGVGGTGGAGGVNGTGAAGGVDGGVDYTPPPNNPSVTDPLMQS